MVSGLVHIVAFLKTKSYSEFIYVYIRSSWTMEMDLKQLSRGLHSINRALKLLFFKGNATHFKTKQRQKQENEMFLILYPRQPVLLLFSGLLLFLFSFL